MEINNCIDCGEQPEHIVSEKSGHTLCCFKCKKFSSGFRRKEYAIEAWNLQN